MRTKLTSLLLALIALLNAPSTFAGGPATNAPVLKVDFAHWMSKKGAGTKSVPYRIKACPSVILDFTDFSFQPPDSLKGKQPNLIRVRYGNFMDGFVHDLVVQPDKKRYELSRATLPKGISLSPFYGFTKGWDYVVQIGILESDGTFSEEWISIIEIR